MNTLAKAVSFLASIVISASLCAAQQVSQTPTQQTQAVAENNIQLVIEGKVINVHDGDTVTVLDQDSKKYHIRLQGIDAPELKQAFGSVSQQNLSRMVLGKQVTIFWTKVDKYRRTVGTIMLDGRDMNIEQIKAGLAWHFKKYEDEQTPEDRHTYAASEREARAAKLGLWNDPNSIPPGDWRQEVKTKRWGPPPPEATIIGNKNSKKYHRPDCPGYRDMAEKNRVFFKSVEEAEEAGYKRAGNCPAEEAVSARASFGLHIVKPAPPSRTAMSYPDMPILVADPMLFPRITANRKSRIYSLPGCSDFAHVAQESLVVFNSAEEAEKAGYRLAADCSARKNAKAPVSTMP